MPTSGVRPPIAHLVATVLLLAALSIQAADMQTGPVIKDFGPVLPAPAGSFNLDRDKHYKVSMDVSATAESPAERNRSLESAARFLNMHARNGIPREHITFAIIVHGAAARDLLTDAAYGKRFNTANPNTLLLRELGDAGVAIYVCGQTIGFRGFGANELNPAVSIALSAMTAHVELQSEGYTLIPF
jgi:intracellular sulfur oxidation DsrE/DsrF family protein